MTAWKVPTDAPRPNCEALERFIEAVAHDERIDAAFIGGSYATSVWDEHSDLDLYVIVDDERYDDLHADREVEATWTRRSRITTRRNLQWARFDRPDRGSRDPCWLRLEAGSSGAETASLDYPEALEATVIRKLAALDR